MPTAHLKRLVTSAATRIFRSFPFSAFSPSLALSFRLTAQSLLSVSIVSLCSRVHCQQRHCPPRWSQEVSVTLSSALTFTNIHHITYSRSRAQRADLHNKLSILFDLRLYRLIIFSSLWAGSRFCSPRRTHDNTNDTTHGAHDFRNRERSATAQPSPGPRGPCFSRAERDCTHLD